MKKGGKMGKEMAKKEGTIDYKQREKMIWDEIGRAHV